MKQVNNFVGYPNLPPVPAANNKAYREFTGWVTLDERTVKPVIRWRQVMKQGRYSGPRLRLIRAKNGVGRPIDKSWEKAYV